MGKSNKELSAIDLIASLVAAVLLNLKLLSQSLVVLLNATDGFFSILLELCYGVFILVSVIQIIKYNHFFMQKSKIIVIVAVIILLLWYFFSLEVTQSSFLMLLVYSIIPIVVFGLTELKTRIVCVACLITSYFAIPVANKLLILDARKSLGMDVSYAFVPCIIAGIVHFFFYRKELKIFEYVIYIPAVFFFFNLILYGVRGPILCIFVAFIFIWYFGSKKTRLSWKKIFVTIGLFFIALFINEIVMGFQVFLNSRGISLYFINKTLLLSETGNVLHGRNELAKIALAGFTDNFLFGKGMNSFLYHTGYDYPHNFFMQFMFEGGLFITVLFCVIAFLGTKRCFSKLSIDSRALYILFFSTSVPYMLLSSNPWNSPLLWMYIGLLLHDIIVPLND